jgi:cytochrome b-561 domain containing protein 2
MEQRFGLVAVIWLVLQIGIGAGTVWFGGNICGGGAKAKAVYKYHRSAFGVNLRLITYGFPRLSGYVLLPWLLITVHLAGAWSTWMVNHTTFTTSLITYTIAPAIVLISVYARMR